MNRKFLLQTIRELRAERRVVQNKLRRLEDLMGQMKEHGPESLARVEQMRTAIINGNFDLK